MTPLYFAQQTLNALQVSLGYGLMAAAYVLIHGVTRRINLAFGALAIWAGYALIQGTLLLMLWLPGYQLLPVALAGIWAVLNTAILAAATERTVIRPLRSASSLAVLIATLYVAIVLEEVLRLSSDSRERWLFPVLNEPVVLIASKDFPVLVTRIGLVAMAVAGLFWLILDRVIEHHSFGRLWRACAEDQRMAELCGVDVGAVVRTTFVLAAAAAATNGVLVVAYHGSVGFHGGLILGLKALLVAVIGGLGSVRGALAGGLLLGCFETFWSAYVSGEYRDVAAMLLLTVLLVLRPAGLLDAASRPNP